MKFAVKYPGPELLEFFVPRSPGAGEISEDARVCQNYSMARELAQTPDQNFCGTSRVCVFWSGTKDASICFRRYSSIEGGESHFEGCQVVILPRG